MIPVMSAIVFTVLTGIVILFHAGLAAGMPWGAASMGGKYPGKYPPKMRVVAIFNIFILALTAIIVLSRAKLFFINMMAFSRIAIWAVAVFFLAGAILTTITPSKIERVWAPVAFIQFIAAVIIALS